jgi:outer membrane receptor protein involved in Fe transport
MRKMHKTALAAFISSQFLLSFHSVHAQEPPAAPATEQPAEAVELKEMVVTGEIQYRDRTETVAPELVYDQEFFAKFEPVSVGDQLRRVPGVAFTSDIGESDAPQLRGLGQGYTQVLVNGRPIPGAGNDRTVFVDRIPAEIIDRIEIIRSPSADIDSQGVGGTINIILKDGESLPPGVIARIGATHDVDAGKTRGNGAISWSGRNENESVFWSITGRRRSASTARTWWKRCSRRIRSASPRRSRATAAAGAWWNMTIRSGRSPWSAPRNRTTAIRRTCRSTPTSPSSCPTTRASGSTASCSAPTARSTRTRSSWRATVASGGLELDDPELEFQARPFPAGQLRPGRPVHAQVRRGERVRGATGLQRLPGRRPRDTFDETPDGLVNREDNEADDKEWTGGLSIKSQMTGWAEAMGIDGVETKFGLSGKAKDRDYRLTVSDDLDDDDFTVSDGRFKYEERRLDAYAVFKWQFNPAVVLETGLRAESTSTEQSFRTDFSEAGELEESIAGEADNDEFELNPSAHLQWKLTPVDQLRFSVARTVRRPSIDQLIPAFELEAPGDEDVTTGNPDLSFETSVGFDLGYEHRIGKRGIFGVNFFYRDISDLIALVNTGQDVSGLGLDPEDFPGGLYTFQNIGDATVSGIEFDLSTPLDFFGMPNTGVFANYTKLDSERDDPATGEDIQIDFQPDYVYNVGVTHDIPTWGAAFGLSYQKQGESRFVTVRRDREASSTTATWSSSSRSASATTWCCA